ncbi:MULTISPECIES: flagellar hook-associated protein 3 [unclassified Oceanispirochaeta]|uniref:flagellar hook-associated protein 3 n=1 Tax=unclassified Oceanispirochaeta TaxID=2635722 RepID=UPI000E098A3A|nr:MULTISPECIES: flagellar hook-associated protein 3 [unclassified Oceanispirochaeta]MBF9014820.1 flagellar hook-associated protein 3 [Oceanispirochaeta sp. M2]NPD71076.1 flagellar hook-associated protein 3 [Oceanispirochaeta sp. M1]RDG33909.1 flagellar hook-associated protein 3 [Oceanispirochaeta sp. M1]
MRRVSTNMPNTDLQYQMRLKDFKMNEMQTGIGSSRRLNNLRDDPIAAAHSTRLSSHITHLTRYSDNIGTAQGEYSLAETSMNQSVQVVQRLRELAVQGSNGTYSKEELGYMAIETNELLKELVSMANTRTADGRTLFGANDTKNDPFVAMKSRVEGIEGAVISEVRYAGNITANQTEIGEGTRIDLNFAGNKVYWAENQQIFAQRDTLDYVVKEDSTISIDGKEIALKTGDNIHGIISKINDSDLAVKASLDPVTNSFTIESTVPHQIWIDEDPDSKVLKDIGLLAESGSRPPENLHKDVMVGGGSLFDMVIGLRDSLLTGDQEAVGGRILGGLDKSLGNLLNNMADLGSRNERLDHSFARLDSEKMNVIAVNSKLTDIDMTEAITNLKMLEYTQKAAYQSASKILQSNLMDFLR